MASVCFTFGTICLPIAFFMATESLVGVTSIWLALPNHLYKYLWNSKIGLLTKFFLQKKTKLLVYLPCQSGKQSKTSISSISNLVFLTCLIISVENDLLFCVDSVFWKELNNCFFCTSSSRISFSWCWAFCPFLCFGGQNELASAHYQRFVHSWQHICHWSGTWKLCTDSPRVGTRNKMRPISVATLMSHISIMWYLKIGRKHILSSWRAIHYFLLLTHFSYV